MPGCSEEVFAACGVGSCLMLQCYEHFNGNLSDVHKLSCKGTAHPTLPEPLKAPPAGVSAEEISNELLNKRQLSIVSLATVHDAFATPAESADSGTSSDKRQPKEDLSQYMTEPKPTIRTGSSHDQAQAQVQPGCKYRSTDRPSDIGTDAPIQVLMEPNCYPQTTFGRKMRRFNPSWFGGRDWLEYSVSRDAA